MQHQILPNVFQSYINEGHTHFTNGKYSKAIDAYTNALLSKTNDYYDLEDAKAFYWRAMAHFKDDKISLAAKEDFNVAIKIDENYIEAYLGRGWAWYHTYQAFKFDKSFRKHALLNFAHAFALYFCHQPAYLELNISDAPKDMIKQVTFEAIKKLANRKERIHFYELCLSETSTLGKIMKKPKNTFFGFSPFESQKCSEEKGTLKQIKKQLALAYAEKGEEELNLTEEAEKNAVAIEHFAKALNYDAECGLAYLGYGRYHTKNKCYENAKFYYQQALRYFTKDIDEAEKNRDKEEAKAFRAQVYFDRARTYYYQGLYANALKDFNQTHSISNLLNEKEEAFNYITLIIFEILQKDAELSPLIEGPGFSHVLSDVYATISPEELWSIMSKLSSEQRLSLREKSALLRCRLAEPNSSSNKMAQTLAEDYVLRAGKYYSKQQIVNAVDDYQAALHFSPHHPIARKQLARIKQGLLLHPVKAGLITDLNSDLDMAEKAKDKSAHDVRKIKQYNLTYYFKPETNAELAYLSALANRYYRTISPWNVATSKAYVSTSGNPVGIRSKGIPNFTTLRDIKNEFINEANGEIEKGEMAYHAWFENYLSQPKNCRRYFKICAIVRDRREDDFHDGNLAIDRATAKLYLFDTDESMFDVKSMITGGRFGVDTLGHRNPQTAFTLAVEDVHSFPRLTVAKPHYNPGRQADHIAEPLTRPLLERFFTKNLYRDAFINLIQNCNTLSKEEILKIEFSISLRHILYYDPFFTGRPETNLDYVEALARLYLPREAAHKDTNLIEMVVKGEIKNDTQFWLRYSSMAEFQFFLQAEEKNNHHALYKSLLICTWHNFKLEKAAKKHPERADELLAAIFSLEKIIINYNKLILFTEKNFRKNHLTENFVSVKEIDPTDYLESIKLNLENDLRKKQINYHQFFNQSRCKPSKQFANKTMTLFGNPVLPHEDESINKTNRLSL
ncbi:MAG: hypothetical protein JO149_09930 [Gammaproteobacteria bacterium]|nr:hypothetical protein [Gammaproteobacteria bacterium]